MTQPSRKHLTELGEIVAGIAHDLASPINVVLFCAESFAEDPNLAKDNRYQGRLLDAAKNLRQAMQSLRQICATGDSLEKGTLADAHRLATNLITMGAGQHIRFEPEQDDPLWHSDRPIGLAELTSQLYQLYRKVWKEEAPEKAVTYSIRCIEHSAKRLEVAVHFEGRVLGQSSFSDLN